MDKKINKVVLAYSGGLDTSAMLLWLKETYGCEVVCYCADVGQGEEMTGLEEKALATGASGGGVSEIFPRPHWQAGLRVPRTPKGYRIFGPGELQRLRTLRELLARFDCALSDVAFAKRYDSDPELRAALEHWFQERAERPEGVASGDWLSWEQRKHERLLATDTPPRSMETTAV